MWNNAAKVRRRRDLGMGRALALAGLACLLTVGHASAQIPDKFENLQVLPKDVPRDSLIQIMRGFSFALGVRCQYCHTGGDGISFEGVVFKNDDDPDKVKARRMLEMVRDLNEVVLANLPERDSPPVGIECKTCHRGRPRPIMLAQELRMALDEFGVDSATARYESYREDDRVLLAGLFDFGEWEVNVLGDRLAREGRTSEAIAIYELNARYYPGSASIQMSLGQLHETEGDTEAAIRSYERALEIQPDNERVKDRLDALRGG